MGYIDLPVSGGGITIYPTLSAFPATAQDGAQGVAADTESIYIYNASLPGWVAVATPPVGVFISDLTGDVTATGPGSAAATVAFVGGESAADVAQSVQDTQAATASSVVSTLVKRDASGETALDGLTLDGSTTGSIKIQSAASVAVPYTVKMPSAQGAASTYLQNDGSGNLSWTTVSAGANTSLSNLVAPTAVNVALLGTVGSGSAPAYSFTGDTDTGMYSSGANTLNLATGGSERVCVDSSGNMGVGTTSPSVRLHAQQTSATTNSVTNILRIDSQSSGTPAAGIGVGIEMAAETAAGNTEIGVVLEALTTDVTSTSEDFDLVVKNMNNGAAAAETLRVTSKGNVQVPNYILSPQLYAGGTKTAAFNIDWSNGPVQEFTLNVSGGTVSLSSSTWSNAVTGGCYMLKLIQGSTPTAVSAWPSSVKWGTAGAPTLSTTTGLIDIINFVYDGTNYYGTYALGF